MDHPEDERKILDLSLSNKPTDKFRGFHQFVEKKLMEEKGPNEDDKQTIMSGLKNMVSMRKIGSMLGLSKNEQELRGGYNFVSASNTARNSIRSPRKTLAIQNKSNNNINIIDTEPRKILDKSNVNKTNIKIENLDSKKKSKSLAKIKKDKNYYEKRLNFLRNNLLEKYPSYNSRSFKRLLLSDRDECDQMKEKLEKKSKKTHAEVIDKLRTFAETWKNKSRRIKKTSVYGEFNSYYLKQMIIKGGDDLRQEMIAMQLMKKFNEIFIKENTGCYLSPYDIIATSSDSGFLEFLTDTVPIDNLKKTYKLTLPEIYELIFSDCFETARKNFIMSLAGYSLYTYLLQIKDRHNGNILISSEGHVLHIDFGFMFTTSPGNINFESAPFKLTKVI